MLVVQGAALIRCARRVSEAVVDGKGLPARCLRASRHTKGADAEGLFHCTLHLRAVFGPLLLSVAAPGRGALGPRAMGPIFLQLLPFNCPFLLSVEQRE